MRPDKRQMKLFADAPNRMEIKDHQKKGATRAPKRKGFTSSADVHIGEEVDVRFSIAPGGTPFAYYPGKVKSKSTDTNGSVTFHVEMTDYVGGEGTAICRLGELYRRMK